MQKTKHTQEDTTRMLALRALLAAHDAYDKRLLDEIDRLELDASLREYMVKLRKRLVAILEPIELDLLRQLPDAPLCPHCKQPADVLYRHSGDVALHKCGGWYHVQHLSNGATELSAVDEPVRVSTTRSRSRK